MGRIKLYKCGKNSRFEYQQYGRLYIKTHLLDQLELLEKNYHILLKTAQLSAHKRKISRCQE